MHCEAAEEIEAIRRESDARLTSWAELRVICSDLRAEIERWKPSIVGG